MAETSQEALESATERTPVELWQKILLRLDYFDLKVVQRVCRGWKELIATPAFDRVLFRRGSSEPVHHITPQMLPVLINPAVKYLSIEVLRSSVAAVLRPGFKSKSKLANLGPVAFESLTDPPTSLAYGNFGFYGSGFKIPPAVAGRSVEVTDLLNELYRRWIGVEFRTPLADLSSTLRDHNYAAPIQIPKDLAAGVYTVLPIFKVSDTRRQTVAVFLPFYNRW